MKQCDTDLKQIAPATRRHEAMRATLKARLQAWAGYCLLVLLFIASLAYVGSGGTLAPDASPVSQAQPPAAALAVELADAGRILRKESVSALSGEEEQ